MDLNGQFLLLEINPERDRAGSLRYLLHRPTREEIDTKAREYCVMGVDVVIAQVIEVKSRDWDFR